MRPDVIVNCALVQMEPIKCLELVAWSHQMSECLFGLFYRSEMRNTSGLGKTCTQIYTVESNIAMVQQ